MTPDKRILVAEDEELQRVHISRTIREMCGFEVMQAMNGKDALDILESGHRFDLLITDNHMPHLSGKELIEVLRGTDKYQSLPIIMITGGYNGDMEPFCRYHRASLLNKPYHRADLMELIIKLLKGV